MAPSDRDGERGRDEDSEDEEDPEDDEGAGGGELGSRGLVHSYKMNHVQRREFTKVRNGEVPNMYGNRKMSDVGFWSQPFIDPVDPSSAVLAGAATEEPWSFTPVHDSYLPTRIHLVSVKR